MPAAIFLWLYGASLLHLWVPRIADASAPLLPVMTVYFLFSVAGQYNAGAVLLGQARHAGYARLMVAEVLLTVTGLFLLIPRFGVFGAACVVTVSILVTRGAGVAVLICRVNGFPLGAYLRGIYERPLIAGLPIGVAAVALRGLLAGTTWPELIAAAAAIALGYYAVAFFVVLDPQHRAPILARLGWSAGIKQMNV